MNRFQEQYNAKKISVEEALNKIKSNDIIMCGIAAAEPISILSQLHTIKDRVDNVSIWQVLGMAPHKFISDPSLKGHIMTEAFFYGPFTRPVHKEGNVTQIPHNLSNGFVRRLSYKKPNVYIGTVSPMDRNGFLSHSLSIAWELDAIEAADLVIMEVNPNCPVVAGECNINIDRIDYIVEVDRPIPVLPEIPITDVEQLIGNHIADLIEDGSTPQLGIGRFPSAARKALISKKDLGIHTEMITSSMADLYEAGVITGNAKTLHKRTMVATLIAGTKKLYDFVNNNSVISMREGKYVNDPYIIGQNDKMVSINGGLEIDLTGQACLESIGHIQFSGTGGSNDFILGANRSRGGKCILALPATAKKGTVSTIVPMLKQGSIVNGQRQHIDYIVTEFGAAHLTGRSVRERVNELIAVAHPDFRQELKDAAFKYEIW